MERGRPNCVNSRLLSEPIRGLEPHLKYIVLGATGFLGRRLVRTLSNADEITIAIGGSRTPEILPHVESASAQQALQLLENLESDRYTVFNCANRFSRNGLNNLKQLSANYLWPLKVLNLLPDSSHVHWIEVSTPWSLSYSKGPLVNLYGLSRLASIVGLRSILGQKEGVLTTVYVGDVFGLDDPRGKVPSVALQLMSTKEAMYVTGGTQVLRPMHVDDVVDGLLSVLDKPWLDRVRLDAGETTLADFVELVNERAGREVIRLREGPIQDDLSHNPFEAHGIAVMTLRRFESALPDRP